MDFEKMLAEPTRDEAFRATVYAMNTLLMQKAYYTEEEFEHYFCEWAEKHPQPERIGPCQ